MGSVTATPKKTPAMTPRPSATPTTVASGGLIQFNAQGTFLKGKSNFLIQDITTSPGTLWSSSDSTILIPPPNTSQGGNYTGGVPGCACIKASSSGIVSPPLSIGVATDVTTCPACPSSFAVTGTAGAQQAVQEDTSPAVQVAQNAGVLMWTFDAGAELRGRIVTGDDSSAYFITRDGVLHGLDSNGKQFVRRQAYGQSPVVLADGTIVAMTSASELAAVAANGTETWRVDIGAGAGPLASSGSAIYAAAGADLVSVSAGGLLNWRVAVGAISTATVTAEGVVVAGERGGLTGLGSDGAIAWTFTPDGGFSGALASSGDAVFAGSASGTVYALDSRTGTVLWRFNSPGAVVAGPAVGPSGIVYFGADVIYGVSADGQLRWTQPGVKAAVAEPISAVGSDSVFAIGVDELGAMLSGVDSGFVWTTRSFGEITATAATSTGMLYVANSNGRIFAIR